MNVRAHRAGFDAVQEMLGLCLDDHLMANEVERLFPGRAKPPFFGWSVFGFDKRIQRILPSARGDTGIAARQIGFSELKVDGGLPHCLIFGEDDLLRGIPVFGIEAGPLAGLDVHKVERASALSTVDQTITSFHRLLSSLQENVSDLLRCYERVGMRWHDLASVENLVPVLVPVSAPCRGKTLTQKRFDLVPVVGLDQQSCFRQPKTS